MPPVKSPNFWKMNETKGKRGKEKGKGTEGILMGKEQLRGPPKRAFDPFRVLNLSGKSGFLTRGIAFTRLVNLGG